MTTTENTSTQTPTTRDEVMARFQKELSEFRDKEIKYMMETFNFPFHVAESIYNKAYYDGHSYGYDEVENLVNKISEFVLHMYVNKRLKKSDFFI